MILSDIVALLDNAIVGQEDVSSSSYYLQLNKMPKADCFRQVLFQVKKYFATAHLASLLGRLPSVSQVAVHGVGRDLRWNGYARQPQGPGDFYYADPANEPRDVCCTYMLSAGRRGGHLRQ